LLYSNPVVTKKSQGITEARFGLLELERFEKIIEIIVTEIHIRLGYASVVDGAANGVAVYFEDPGQTSSADVVVWCQGFLEVGWINDFSWATAFAGAMGRHHLEIADVCRITAGIVRVSSPEPREAILTQSH
jgi:hypothetical protein